MHVLNYPPFFPDHADFSKGCMREYLEVCEVKSGRRACQANAKHLTWRKNMGNWEQTHQLYTYATQSAVYFGSMLPFHKEEKNMDDSRNNTCNAGSNYCHDK